MPNPWPQTLITTAVVASPALAAETIIASLAVGSVADSGAIIDLTGWAAYTVGTSGTAVRFRIRRTNVSGTVVGDTGALTRAAASLQSDDLEGVDTPGEIASLTYVLTMQVTAGAAASTVTAVKLRAQVSG